MTKASPEFIQMMQEDIQKHKDNAKQFREWARFELNWMKQKQRQLLSYQKRYAK